jgi:hypothetical protein
MKIELELELTDELAAHLTAHLAEARKPPRQDAATGSVIIESRYARGMEIEQWAGEVLNANIADTLRNNPSPSMLEHRRRITVLEEGMRGALGTVVRARRSPNPQ